MVELLFLPSVYAPVPDLPRRALQRRDAGGHATAARTIADVLGMTVDDGVRVLRRRARRSARSLRTLREVGLGYLRLGQPATELSGGEAQRIKLATELQRAQRGHTLYVLDEPTTGLHPADVERLMAQLDGLVDAGNTVVVVEHDMGVVARRDWVIDSAPARATRAAGSWRRAPRSRSPRCARAAPRRTSRPGWAPARSERAGAARALGQRLIM